MKTVIGAAMLAVFGLANTPGLAADKTGKASTEKPAAASHNGPAVIYEPERTLVDHGPGKGRDVSPALADWLVRNHARPAGR